MKVDLSSRQSAEECVRPQRMAKDAAKTGGKKITPNSLQTTDVKQILATDGYHLMLLSQPPFWYILSEGG